MECDQWMRLNKNELSTNTWYDILYNCNIIIRLVGGGGGGWIEIIMVWRGGCSHANTWCYECRETTIQSPQHTSITMQSPQHTSKTIHSPQHTSITIHSPQHTSITIPWTSRRLCDESIRISPGEGRGVRRKCYMKAENHVDIFWNITHRTQHQFPC